MGPVDLSLLANERLESQISLAASARTEGGHERAKVILGARVPPFLAHAPEPARRERRELLPLLPEELHVRIEQRRPGRLCRRRARLAKDPLDDFVMNAELGCDRAYRPLLDREESQDLDFELPGNRHSGLL